MNQTNQTMRVFALSVLAFCTVTPLFSQEDCDVFNIQDLAADYLSFGVDTVILQLDGSYEVQLSNGTTASITLGCTDPGYFEYDASANADDGSCASLIVPGCTNPTYVEFDPAANQDDGSCANYDPTCVSPTLDGRTYDVVYIGGQCWFAENLQTETYANGDAIPGDLDNASWSASTEGAQAVQGNDVTNLPTYGRLYNWAAIQDERNVCPSGWYVPSNEDWNALISNVGVDAGTKLKSVTGWNDPNAAGTDDFGFGALPGGYRFSSGGYYGPGGLGDYWSTSTWRQFNSSSEVAESSVGTVYEEHGFSVRCLRGGDIQGCLDPNYLEFNPAANTDDGSCATLVVNGCTDPAYVEYDATANTDDGSCATLPCTGPTMDGYTYSVVEIGDQCWFAENLRTAAYNDGSMIASGLDDGGWTTTMAGATTVNGEGNSSCSTFSSDFDACDVNESLMAYGRLYNWYAVEDARGLCPSGWHVPSDGEWTELEGFVASEGSSGAEATALKSVSGWTGGGNGTDVHGFSALPGGVRFYEDGSFPNAGAKGYWWSSTSAAGDLAWRRRFMSTTPAIDKLNSSKRNGFSVRCLRDSD